MNYSDLLIIYLSLGAPFGAYFYISKRKNTDFALLKSALAVILWVPYSFKLLWNKVSDKLKRSELSDKSARNIIDPAKLADITKELEQSIPKENNEITLFEFRDIIERYAGLTIAKNQADETPAEFEKEFFRISGSKTPDTGAVCLNRRNRSRLISHQRDAREIFLNIVDDIFYCSTDNENFHEQLIEFVKLINDDEALPEIAKIIPKETQSVANFPVNDLENDLWTPEIQQQSTEQPKQILLKTSRTPATSPKNDWKIS